MNTHTHYKFKKEFQQVWPSLGVYCIKKARRMFFFNIFPFLWYNRIYTDGRLLLSRCRQTVENKMEWLWTEDCCFWNPVSCAIRYFRVFLFSHFLNIHRTWSALALTQSVLYTRQFGTILWASTSWKTNSSTIVDLLEYALFLDDETLEK